MCRPAPLRLTPFPDHPQVEISGSSLPVSTASAAAEFLTGNALYEFLLKAKAVMENRPGYNIRKASIAQGFVMGMVDSLNDQAHPRWKIRFCVPANASVGQISDVILKFLTDQPSLRHLPASNLTMLALEQAFPCRQ